MSKKTQSGKGDKPRNCFSRSYKDNYDMIQWGGNKKCANASNARKTSLKQN